MASRFDDLMRLAAGEGASAPLAFCPETGEALADGLMEAWYRERQDRLEIELFLEQADQLLRLALGGQLTPAQQLRAKRLLLAVKQAGLESKP